MCPVSFIQWMSLFSCLNVSWLLNLFGRKLLHFIIIFYLGTFHSLPRGVGNCLLLKALIKQPVMFVIYTFWMTHKKPYNMYFTMDRFPLYWDRTETVEKRKKKRASHMNDKYTGFVTWTGLFLRLYTKQQIIRRSYTQLAIILKIIDEVDNYTVDFRS